LVTNNEAQLQRRRQASFAARLRFQTAINRELELLE
jgi:hypothetical protein